MAKKATDGRKPKRKNAMREQAARQRRRQNLMLWGGIAAVVLVIIGLFALNAWSNRPVGEEVSLRSQGNTHIADDALEGHRLQQHAAYLRPALWIDRALGRIRRTVAV